MINSAFCEIKESHILIYSCRIHAKGKRITKIKIEVELLNLAMVQLAWSPPHLYSGKSHSILARNFIPLTKTLELMSRTKLSSQ